MHESDTNDKGRTTQLEALNARRAEFQSLARADDAAGSEEYKLLREAEQVGHIGSYSRDLRTGAIRWSDETYRIFGHEPGEISPTVDFVTSHIHPEDREEFLEANRAVVEEDKPYDVQYRIVRKDGSIRAVHSRASVERDSAGRPARLFGVMQDITARKQTEEELRALSARHEAILAEVPDIIAEVDANKVYTWVNQAGLEFFGPEVLGREAALYFEGEQDTYKTVQPLFNGSPHVFYTESWQRRRDGAKRLLAWWCRALVDAEGNVTGALSTARDITEHKRVEEALRKSEAQLRAILDATPFPIALVDVQDHQIDFWSRSALVLFGHTAPTAPQWYQIAYPDPDYRSEVIDRWKPSLEKARRSAQAVNTGEYRVTCHDGSVRICELYAAFLADRLIVTFHDITERKKAEEALRAHREQLRVLASELSLAEERERRRIAMALHDHTCQSLAMARMKLDELLEFASAAQAETLGGIGSVLNDTIESVRGLTFDLSSPTLYRFGLEAALEELLEDKFGAKQGIQYDFSDDGEPKPLTEDVQVLLFQSVREVLINILKHARAHKITLDIRRTDGSITEFRIIQ
ncbi:MAG: PAS domain S-box protein [Phycisphaerae bacterium]|nr:PAS domain S-box protein [Phycisphaerae bacterium]